jgi:hypothetical protein
MGMAICDADPDRDRHLESLNTNDPHIARIHDFLLGGY